MDNQSESVDLDDIRLFVQVVRSGTFTGAARALGLPKSSVSRRVAELEARLAGDVDTSTGKVLGGVYRVDADTETLAADVYRRVLGANALWVNLFPSIAAMEKDLVRAVASLLGGDKQVVGNVTSGGTESIMLGVKTARDRAREQRPELATPEVVVPITAHPAFHKAAHYLGMRVKVTPVDPQGYRADVEAMRAAITDDTVLLVASAPNFSHGTIDPVESIAALALERGLSCHVDCCVGGLILPFQRQIGESLRPFDFAVPGVTTISADLHKYGYVPKNASVILYRNRDLRRHAFFVCSGTTEYVVINPTVQSSRTGGPVAAAWALMRALGMPGYEALTRQVMAGTRAAIAGIDAIDGLRVLADPESCMFTFAADPPGALNIFELSDRMLARGWQLVPQFACGGSPANLHVAMAPGNVARVPELIADLEACTRALLAEGPSFDEAALTEEVAAVADAHPLQIMMKLAPRLGLGGGGIPERLGPLNTVMNLLSAETRDALFVLYMNSMA